MTLENSAELRLLEIKQRLVAGLLHFLKAGELFSQVRSNRDWEFYHLSNFSEYCESLHISYQHASRLAECHQVFVDKWKIDPDRLGKIGLSRLFAVLPITKNAESLETVNETLDHAEQTSIRDLRKGGEVSLDHHIELDCPKCLQPISIAGAKWVKEKA